MPFLVGGSADQAARCHHQACGGDELPGAQTVDERPGREGAEAINNRPDGKNGRRSSSGPAEFLEHAYIEDRKGPPDPIRHQEGEKGDADDDPSIIEGEVGGDRFFERVRVQGNR